MTALLFLLSFLVQSLYKGVLFQCPENFLDDIQFTKAALSVESKDVHTGVNTFDGISPRLLESALTYLTFLFFSVAVFANVSFPVFGKKAACTTRF